MRRVVLAIAFGASAALLVILLASPRPSAMDRVAAAAADDWRDLVLEVLG